MRRTAPAMTIRGMTVFPGAECQMFVGRPPTMTAVRKARGADEPLIAVFAQRQAAQNDGLGAADIYPYGTLCRLEAVLELKDQSMKLLLVGAERIELEDLTTGPEGELVAAFHAAERGLWSGDVRGPGGEEVPAARDELRAALSAWAPKLDDANEHSDWQALRSVTEWGAALRHARALIAVPLLGDEYWSWQVRGEADLMRERILDEAVHIRQRMLEADDALLQAALLRSALAFDASVRLAEDPPNAR